MATATGKAGNSVSDETSLKLNPEQMEAYRRAFLAYYDDFESFQQRSGRQHLEERAYKEELVTLHGEVLPPSVFDGELTQEHADDIVARALKVIRAPLPTYHSPQNLLSWRYTGFLAKLSADERLAFAGALRDLLHGTGDSPERLERFNQVVHPIMQSHDVRGWAPTRSLPTFFLMLDRPGEDIFVRTENFSLLWREMFGEWPFQDMVFDAREYRRALHAAQQIRAALSDWGWRPRDMIDVQSFLWGVTAKPGPSPESHSHGGGMTDLMDRIDAQGLYFPAELVSNYLLSLQARRFVLLTGISGTGKTRLALVVAKHFTGGEEERYEVVSVRPDWTDNRGLLGWHNPLTGGYSSTPFLKLVLRAGQELVAAQKEGREPDPYFVILDEMNLARVEHYFSDFLSCLESGEPMLLHDEENLEIDGIPLPSRVTVPTNLFITGTVNVDETTYMFSPKVLDRAFTIELNVVDLDAIGQTGSRSGEPTPLWLSSLPAAPVQLAMSASQATRSGQRSPADEWAAFKELEDGHLAISVVALNGLLTPWGRHFGYRVAIEIARYVCLARSQAGESAEVLQAALDLAVLQKVLPKLHGTQQQLQDVLDGLLSYAVTGAVGADPVEPDAWTVDGDQLVPTGAGGGESAALPRTAAKLWRMMDRLQRQGFTSYVE